MKIEYLAKKAEEDEFCKQILPRQGLPREAKNWKSWVLHPVTPVLQESEDARAELLLHAAIFSIGIPICLPNKFTYRAFKNEWLPLSLEIVLKFILNFKQQPKISEELPTWAVHRSSNSMCTASVYKMIWLKRLCRAPISKPGCLRSWMNTFQLPQNAATNLSGFSSVFYFIFQDWNCH